MKNQSGFTMIELVVVIVILGILAAVAVPKFSDLRSDARASSLRGLAGGLRSAAAMARAQYIVNGDDTATTITMDGDSVTVVAGTGYPVAVAGGIDEALESYEGFDATLATAPGTTATFVPENFTGSDCQVEYDQADGTAEVTDSGC